MLHPPTAPSPPKDTDVFGFFSPWLNKQAVLKGKQVAASATYKAKHKIVLSFEISLFISFIPSCMILLV